MGTVDALFLQCWVGGGGGGELGQQPLTGLTLWALGPLLDEDLRRLQVCLPGQQHRQPLQPARPPHAMQLAANASPKHVSQI